MTPDERGNYRIDDMVLTEDQTFKYFGLTSSRSGIRGRSGVPYKSFRWPIKNLIYQFDDNYPFSNKEKAAIRQMIRKFNSEMNGCLSISYI